MRNRVSVRVARGRRLLAALCAFAGPWLPSAGASTPPVASLSSAAPTVLIDPEKSPIKDQRDSTCAPDLGYAGCLVEVSLYNDAFSPWAYGEGIKETEAALRMCGARFLRMWNALETWQRGMAGEWNTANPKVYFSLWKKMGIRILLTLENYSVFTDKKCTRKSGDIRAVTKATCDFVQWLVRNKFTDVVAGFELGNEPYFGNDPETYGARWCAVVPEIKRIWPEAAIGMPIAEYRAGDPDLDAVRKRLGEKKMMAGTGEFEINRFNQWSGRFVTAMSNQLDNISHVIYHFYGGDAAYGCGAAGFARVHKFAEIYPQIAGKRVWITEWRERSDEDVRCHQMFFSTLWKAHYMLAVLAQPDVDGVNQHCLGCYSGGLNISMNCSFQGQPWRSGFYFQSDPSGGYAFYGDPDVKPGQRRYLPGPAAPLYRMYTDALVGHPIILDHGTLGGQGAGSSCWASAIYYESANAERSDIIAGKSWKAARKPNGNVEWIAALSPRKDSLALLMVNTTLRTQTIPVKMVRGGFNGTAKVETVSCPHRRIYYYNIPAENPLWSTDSFELSLGALAEGKLLVPIAPDTIQTVTVPISRTGN